MTSLDETLNRVMGTGKFRQVTIFYQEGGTYFISSKSRGRDAYQTDQHPNADASPSERLHYHLLLHDPEAKVKDGVHEGLRNAAAVVSSRPTTPQKDDFDDILG